MQKVQFYKLAFIGFLPLFFSVCLACVERAADQETDVISPQTSQNLFGTQLNAPIPLTVEAQEATKEWSVFEDFHENVDGLGRESVPSLQVKSEQLQRQTDSLLKTVPQPLNTKPIVERLVLVHTRARLLHQKVQGPQLDSLQIEMALGEFMLSTQNFFVQINGKFNKNKIDDELRDVEKKELEQQQRFIDSVYQAELKDNQG